MRVLALESSCDETAVALYQSGVGLLDEQVHTQLEHADFGGVVPELAARDHQAKLGPMVSSIIKKNNININDIDAICYTSGPGLSGALLVAASFAHGLAEGLQIPVLGVNHLEGHVMAVFLEDTQPTYPFLSLLVSGGHTQLIAVESFGVYRTLGETLDDAVGEAFDKTAKLLGMGYPGGAQLAACADQAEGSDIELPCPMINRPGLDFSFSGLKTHVANIIRSVGKLSDERKASIAWAFQEAVAKTLAIKCRRAVQQTGLRELVVCGGVAANQRLRSVLHHCLAPEQTRVIYPSPRWCTDNAAMIAYVGHQRLQRGERSAQLNIRPRWPLHEL